MNKVNFDYIVIPINRKTYLPFKWGKLVKKNLTMGNFGYFRQTYFKEKSGAFDFYQNWLTFSIILFIYQWLKVLKPFYMFNWIIALVESFLNTSHTRTPVEMLFIEPNAVYMVVVWTLPVYSSNKHQEKAHHSLYLVTLCSELFLVLFIASHLLNWNLISIYFFW